MRLKSKYITLVALIVLTATPRAFDQLADWKNFAQERFRAELLNIFWKFTPPESRRGIARENSELLARMQANATTCDGVDEIKAARVRGTANSVARSTAPAIDLGHPQLPVSDQSSPEHFIADAAYSADESEELPDAREDATALDKQEKVALIARQFEDYPVFDEFAAPVRVEDAVAQFEWSQEGEASATPVAKPVATVKSGLPVAQRFAWKFVQSHLQNRLPKNIDLKLNEIIVNTETLIKAQEALPASKPKCRVRVLRLAPDAPRTLAKPAVIS